MLPLFGGIAGLFQELALGTGEGILAFVDASGGKFPKIAIGGVAILAGEENARLGLGVVDGHDDDGAGMADEIAANTLAAGLYYLLAADVEDWRFVSDFRRKDADALSSGLGRGELVGGAAGGVLFHCSNISRDGGSRERGWIFAGVGVSAILRAMPRPSISIVGAGNFGSALAQLLVEAGYAVHEIVTRAGKKPSKAAHAAAQKGGAAAVALDRAALNSELLWLCVPDDAIGDCASKIAKRGTTAKIVLHSSGALASDVLEPLRKRGVSVGGAHPLMSFVAGPAPSMDNVLFAVEGDRAAVAAATMIARDLGAVSFTIKKDKKALYHAFGAFTSPLLVAHLATAERLAREAGVPKASIRKAMRPIIGRTLENYFANGAAASFSGPLVRGDVETIRKHLKALRRYPRELSVYSALISQSLEVLPVANRAGVKRLLKRK